MKMVNRRERWNEIEVDSEHEYNIHRTHENTTKWKTKDYQELINDFIQNCSYSHYMHQNNTYVNNNYFIKFIRLKYLKQIKSNA